MSPSKLSYWDERYKRDVETFDWYQDYVGFRDVLGQYCKKSDKILMAGCGNALLTEDMYNDGFSTITGVDFSRVVIERQKDKYRHMPTLSWEQQDITALEFKDEIFDVCINKAAMDALLCGEGSASNSDNMCKEAIRVLKPEGILLIISFDIPEHRLRYLNKEEFDWTVTVETVLKPVPKDVPLNPKDVESKHYIYTCKKNKPAEGAAEL
jgi:ubiquinone/menaquinone biosynthesis C-methylase UbiE